MSPTFAIRSTVSTGFRAPGVQQLFYGQRSTNLNAAGVLTDTLTARQDSDVTRAFGIQPLKEEESTAFTAGPCVAAEREVRADRRLLPDRHQRPHHLLQQHPA